MKRAIFLFSMFLLTLSSLSATDYPRYRVMFFLTDECKISQYYATEIARLMKENGSNDIDWVAVFPNKSSKPENIEAFFKKYGLTIRYETDYDKKLSKKWEMTVTPETIVIDIIKDKPIYKGRIDDAYIKPGKKRSKPSTHELEDVVNKIIAHETPAYTYVPAVGCFINFKE